MGGKHTLLPCYSGHMSREGIQLVPWKSHSFGQLKCLWIGGKLRKNISRRAGERNLLTPSPFTH